MATEEERDKLRSTVTSLLKELSAIDATSLGRRADLSPDINFESIVPEFQVMLDLVRQLNDRDLSRLPHQELTRVQKGLTHLETFITNVRSFTLNQGNPADVCANLKTQTKSGYDDIAHPLMLSLAFTATQGTDYARIEREATGFHTRLKGEFDAFSKTLKQQEEEGRRALAAIKEQAAQAGVSAHSQLYAEEANAHEKFASKWFWATAIACGVTLVAALAGFIFTFYYTPSTVPEAVQYIVAKIIVLSVLSFAILWCSRNYHAEKHNQTLNRHRANSLGTFQTFIEGTQDVTTKDAILLFCADAAFGHRPTGYDKNEGAESPSHIVNPVVELLNKGATKIPQ